MWATNDIITELCRLAYRIHHTPRHTYTYADVCTAVQTQDNTWVDMGDMKQAFFTGFVANLLLTFVWIQANVLMSQIVKSMEK